MKRTLILSLGAVALFLSSCQTVAEKASGTYKGVWTASGPGFTTTTGVFGDGGQLTVTADGPKRIDMVFASPGNPTVNIQNVDLTDIFGTEIFNLGDTQSGTIDVTGTIAANILVMTYSNSVDSVDLSLSDFTK